MAEAVQEIGARKVTLTLTLTLALTLTLTQTRILTRILTLTLTTTLTLTLTKEEIRRLRARVDELEAGSTVAMRPVSRERLPTMEGVTAPP